MSVRVSRSQAARRHAAGGRLDARAMGTYEQHIGSAIVPNPESEGGCWTYRGRLPLAEVRRYTVGTLTDTPLDDDTRFRATCRTSGCVRPDHLDAAGRQLSETALRQERPGTP